MKRRRLAGRPLSGRRLIDPDPGLTRAVPQPGAGGGSGIPANAIVMEDGNTPIVTEAGDYIVLES